MHNVSPFEACKTIMDAANAKGDEDMLHVLRGVNNDLIAADAKYHKACHTCNLGKRNITLQNLKLEASDVSSFCEQAFKELADESTKDLKLEKRTT